MIQYDEAKAAEAYLAYVAILAQEKLDPALRANAAWIMLRQAAFANFFCAFEVQR